MEKFCTTAKVVQEGILELKGIFKGTRFLYTRCVEYLKHITWRK